MAEKKTSKKASMTANKILTVFKKRLFFVVFFIYFKAKAKKAFAVYLILILHY